ncbi:lipopolysaccharide assembly protein LapB [Phocoenobacter skyensis]|uniref:Lipopolysaccharide assembly protein B n=1 Tax=Phocoenobacter skyensis TaxID=97481 RepID=A0A1H7U686_9PAST|nr:lipopolysaccharide assembly protein LapB [Pasteurella skyensis]MDP8078763.1 lipopolysaccharide assembly protein LapB [Pasteurella skyensis]MDP8084758.1 lipopolysaccharide assembly protein LapB [Pasteurella skyensis]MDP8170172.1 lipopolysaccharide assembly protein LapB [Pasteurella skyensis]MDP8174427.1 lipopolysaccharide assembly protein LapB [Pasteurella skyensis]MDP8184096.1 lipopolysaccharide assembly protein LapB [Pasteurella skyensis]
MLELLFLLLPIAALYGWYMGQRSVRKAQDSQNNKFSRDYMTGLNFLLSNQQEKAVDLFLSMVQNQNEEQIGAGSQFEAELTLGNLFRSRGEVDRALMIHRKLDENPNYTIEQKLLVKQQLAKDFMKVGFYDRAENYYIELLDEPEFALNSLTQLMNIYQRTQEWKNAINVAEKLIKVHPTTERISLSHYYCEYSNVLQQQNKNFLTLLNKALEINPNCVRASILLGDYYSSNQQYDKALNHFQQVLTQDPDYISEVIDKIKHCYIQLNTLDDFEFFLIKANQIKHNSAIDIALAELIESKDGELAAKSKLYQQISKHPDMITFQRFIEYQINEVEGTGKKSLMLLHKMVGETITQRFKYHCINCGYQGIRLNWFCPSCRNWETIKPVQSLENMINN